MKRKLCFLTGFILLAAVITISILATKSDLWQQDLVAQEEKKWEAIDSGWIVNDNKSPNNYMSITFSRTFFADEVYEILNKQIIKQPASRPNKETDLADMPVIFFLTHNQNVMVFVDSGEGDKLIYSFGNNGEQIVGSESGNAIHCVAIPKAGKQNVIVTIQLTPSFISDNMFLNKFLYITKKNVIPKIYFGWRSVCIVSYQKSFVPDIIPIVAIFALGVFVLLLFIIILVIKKKCVLQYLYWGFFAILCSSGFICESRIGYFISENSFLIYFLSTIIITIYPILFLQYMYERTTMPSTDVIARIFTIISPINTVLVCLGAICPLLPFSLVRTYALIVLGLFIVFMIIITLREAVSTSGTFNGFSIIILISGGFILIDYIRLALKINLTDIFFFSRIGMTLFFLVCVILITKEKIDDEFLNERSKILQKSAYSDILTDCKNSTALWLDNRKLDFSKEKPFLALVYITNIAEINKADGYSAGDIAVKEVAQILKTVFSKESVYRLSGTKFGIMLNSEKATDFEKNHKKINLLIDSYNEKSLKHKIEIKGAISQFKPSVDVDFDMLYFRVLKQLQGNEN